LRKLAEVRHQVPANVSSEVRLGPLLIDTARVKASVGGVELDTTAREFELLLLLAINAGDFVHRQHVARTLRQSSDESRSVDMHVCRLRRKLRQAGERGLTIHTVYGRGYCLTYDEDSTADRDVARWCA
jgi:DNA-binding response OmpR family regulator